MMKQPKQENVLEAVQSTNKGYEYGTSNETGLNRYGTPI